MNQAVDHPHEDRLLYPRELARIVGLNEKAIRRAFGQGLRHITIGNPERPYCKTTLRWWKMWIDANEHSSLVDRTSQGDSRHSAETASTGSITRPD